MCSLRGRQLDLGLAGAALIGPVSRLATRRLAGHKIKPVGQGKGYMKLVGLRVSPAYPKIRDVYTPCCVVPGASVRRKKEAVTDYSIVVSGIHENLGQLDVHNKVFRV